MKRCSPGKGPVIQVVTLLKKDVEVYRRRVRHFDFSGTLYYRYSKVDCIVRPAIMFWFQKEEEKLTPFHSYAEPNWRVKYGRRAAFESVWFGRLDLERQRMLNSAGGRCCHVPNLVHKLLYCIFHITALVIGSKLSGVTSHAWSSKPSLKIKTTKYFMSSIYVKRDCLSEVL